MRCRPDLRLNRVTELTRERLTDLKVRGLLLDLDNTLLPPGEAGPLPKDILAWAERLRRGGIKLALVTNAKPHRIKRVAAALGVPGIGPAAKPLPFGFLRALRVLGLSRHEALAVGDQVFTDLLGARLAGIRIALVRPLAHDALPHTWGLRRLERLCLDSMETPPRGRQGRE